MKQKYVFPAVVAALAAGYYLFIYKHPEDAASDVIEQPTTGTLPPTTTTMPAVVPPGTVVSTSPLVKAGTVTKEDANKYSLMVWSLFIATPGVSQEVKNSLFTILNQMYTSGDYNGLRNLYIYMWDYHNKGIELTRAMNPDVFDTVSAFRNKYGYL